MSDKDTRNSLRRGRPAPGMASDDDMMAPSSDPDAPQPETDPGVSSERTSVFRAPSDSRLSQEAQDDEPPPSADATMIRMRPERPEPKRSEARRPAPGRAAPPALREEAPDDEPPPSADATVIRMRPEPPPQRNRTLASRGKAEAPLAEKPTLPPASRPRPGEALQDKETLPPSSAALARPVPRAPVKDAPPARAVAPRAPSGGAGGPAGLSVADKARRRREAGETVGGQLSLWWGDLSRQGKAVVGLLTASFVVGIVAALVIAFRPKFEQSLRGEEPTGLGASVLKDSFGLGEGVTWEQADMKAFEFDFVSPTRAVAVIRYHASGISKDEVSISVNAVSVGWVPADTVNTAERELQQILSPSMLKRGGLNQIVFDNVRNPPGQDSWRVWNLRLEVIPVPNLRPEELLQSARTSAARARTFYDRKTVGRENLLLAWENFRAAWITLEALDEKPDLYEDVRHMLSQVSVELDQKCGQLLLDFQRNIQFKDAERAAQVLDEINLSFPTTSHRCHNLSIEKASQYGL